MRPTEVGREFFYPATRGSVLAALIGFFLLLELAAFGRVFGVFLAAIVLPGLLRYLMRTLDARARGTDPGVPGVELFLWFDEVWSIFPVLHGLVLIYGALLLHVFLAPSAAWLFVAICASLLPASLIVLAVTRSPAESLRPASVTGVIRRTGPAYVLAPAYVAAAAALVVALGRAGAPGLLVDLAACYLVFAGFAITGGLARPARLHEEVSIPDPVLPGPESRAASLERDRRQVLNHAYGFVSRGNTGGGLAHIDAWLARDPEPLTAGPWFLEQMFAWEHPDAGLAFAQRRLGQLLDQDRQVEAVKLMLRARLVDSRFRPLPQDHARALAAARYCQHEELVSFLR